LKKFLIIQTAFIGDVVLSTAVAEKLHRFYPDAIIDFMLRKGNESLLEEHPYIRNVLVWNKKVEKYGGLFRLLKTVRKEKYDLVVNMQRFGATGFLTAFSGAGQTSGFDKNPFSFLFSKKITHLISAPGKTFHEVDRNQMLIAHITDHEAAKPRLYPTATAVNAVAQFKNEPYICIAPASVWFTKQYPKEKWTSFLKKLPSSLKVYVIGAPTDTALANEIIGMAGGNNLVNLCGKLSLLESVALQRDATMNYVNDSGPMHFASAVNAPVTAIYCSTVPSFGFGPLSDRRFIVETPVPLDCRPCGLHGLPACPLGHFNCAHFIKDEQLLVAISELTD
jgi:ADP-heptose:LPS heptosyltransferase